MTVKWKKPPVHDFIILSCLAVCGTGLLLCSRPVSAAVTHALGLCTDVLLPSLFPFLVLSSFLVSSGALIPVSNLMAGIMQRVFGLPGCCGTAILLGAIGGYPVGARTVCELYSSCLCSKQDAEKTLFFCNNAGPSFLIGVLGANMLHDGKIGLRLYLIHILSALLIGLLVCKKTFHTSAAGTGTSRQHIKTPVLPVFLQAVTGSFHVFLNICAFVLLFAVLLCLLEQSGLLLLLSQHLPGDAALWNGLVFGVLELTSGSDLLVKGSVSPQIMLSALSFLCGWGGLSVQMQTICLLHDTRLPAKRYLVAKAAHGVLAAILTFLFCR